jgi:hypothetical protein
MVRKSKPVKQQDTRRSSRIAAIQARTTSSNASATASHPVQTTTTKSVLPGRNVIATQNTTITKSATQNISANSSVTPIQATRRSARIAAIQTRTTSSNASATVSHPIRNIQNKRKSKVVNEEVTSDRNTDKRLRQIDPSTSTSRNAIASIHKSKVIQNTIPQATTIADKKWGKATSSVLPPTILSTRKRGNNTVEKEDHNKQTLKRRKWNNFTVPIPTRPKRIGQVYAIGSNDMSQCGSIEGTEIKDLSIIPLEKFKVVDISAGALHSAALTFDGKVVTWGCNDHGKLNYLVMLHHYYSINIFIII